MSFDDEFSLQILRDMYQTFGVDAEIRRGDERVSPVRIIVNRGQERLGEFGQVVGRVTTVACMVSEWKLAPGDVVTWKDRLGNHQKKVEQPKRDDGFEIEVVLYG